MLINRYLYETINNCQSLKQISGLDFHMIECNELYIRHLGRISIEKVKISVITIIMINPFIKSDHSFVQLS